MHGKALPFDLRGAAFLMATSAIGPGFLTQTAVFTETLGASFAFAILVSIFVDLVAQLNIWRVLTVTRSARAGRRTVVPGMGWLLAVLVAIGGLAFNIGNLAGTGLGLQAPSMDPRMGASLSAVIAVGLFVVPEAGRAMDRFAQLLGILMILLALYVAVASHPPYADALQSAFLPSKKSIRCPSSPSWAGPWAATSRSPARTASSTRIVGAEHLPR